MTGWGVDQAVARLRKRGLKNFFIQAGGDFSRVTAGDLASRHPKTIGPDELATTAVAQMERFSITALVVIEPPNRLAGVIHLHDLLKHGIV